MTDRFDVLETKLLSIAQGLRRRGVRSDAVWERNALATALNNVDTYARTLKYAMQLEDVSAKKKTACAASGMNKGISELSLLDHGPDDDLIYEISEASALALDLCFSSEERVEPAKSLRPDQSHD